MGHLGLPLNFFLSELSYPQVLTFGDNLLSTNQVMSRWGPCQHLLPGATRDHRQTWTGLGVTCSLGWGKCGRGEAAAELWVAVGLWAGE